MEKHEAAVQVSPKPKTHLENELYEQKLINRPSIADANISFFPFTAMQNFDLTIDSSASQRQKTRLTSFPNPQRASMIKQISAKIKAETKEVYKVRALVYFFLFNDLSKFEKKSTHIYL